VTTLNIRCCCNPRRVIGTVEVPSAPTGEGEIATERGVMRVRTYYETRGNEYYTELAVVAHEGVLG
jgi:hypothetical protein